MKKLLLTGILSFFYLLSPAQDSLNLTFRYYPSDNAQRVFLPGEFNNWGNNTSGRIAVNDGSLMEKNAEETFWFKTLRLPIGGGGTQYESNDGYAYKMHEQYNDSGSDWNWFTDPLNDIAVGNNNDSWVRIQHPMVFQLEPSNGAFALETQASIQASVAALNTDSIDVEASRIVINDEDIAAFGDFYDKERQMLLIPSFSALGGNLNLPEGETKLKLVAVTKAGVTRSDSTIFTYSPAPEVVEEARPLGLQDGITYGEDGTSVTLSLFAPHKQFVHVVGDFNNWLATDASLMKRDSLNADSVWYWIELTGLTAGEEYAFQYLVDGELRVSDPYSEVVLTRFDQGIPSSTYPNLKPFPSEAGGFIATLLQPGRTEYQWKTTDYVRPAKENLMIYELLVRDFIEERNYKTLADTLDYLEKLGINAIELMPVQEFENNESWGYNPTHHMALDKYYGTINDFKAFIDECHSRGIAVILDAVYNHAYGPSPLVRLWNDGDYGPPTLENPYLNREDRNTVFSFGYDFNHESPATRYWMDRVNQYWIQEFKIDGFRMDFTKGMTQTVGDGGAYDAPRIRILQRMADKIWEVDPDNIIILEHFAPDAEEIALSNYGMLLWGGAGDHNNYLEGAMGYHDGGKSNFRRVFYGNRNWTKPYLVSYIESHDEERLMYKALQFGNSSGDYDITELPTALNRSAATAALFFTIPGPKMIWQFGEYGYDYSIDFNGRVGNKPVRWDYLDDPNRKALYNTYAAIIKFRNENAALFSDLDAEVSLSVSLGNKRIRVSNEDMAMTVITNMDVEANDIIPGFQETGWWYDYLSGDSLEVSDVDATMELAPGEFHIYTNVKQQTPTEEVLTSVRESNTGEIVTDFALKPAYPNPFNPSTNIDFDIAEPATVNIEVYDVMGRKVATLIEQKTYAQGSHSVRFDAQGLSSGMYLVRMRAGLFTNTQRITLLK